MIDPAALFARAEAAFAQNRFDVARRDLVSVLQLVGEHGAVLHLLALTCRRAGNPNEAKQIFQRALRAAPDDVQIRNNYANLLMAEGDQQAALTQYDRILAYRPDFSEARINRAIARQRVGDAHGAHDDLRLMGQTHDDPRVQTILGFVLLDLHRVDEAASAFDRALSVDPRRTSANEGRARVALKRGEDHAEGLYDKALAQLPGSVPLTIGKALAAESSGDPERGISLLTALVDRDGLDPEVQTELARMLSEAGYGEVALDAFALAASNPKAPLNLHQAYVTALAHADSPAAVISHAESLSDEYRTDPVVALQWLAALDKLGLQEAASAAAAQLEKSAVGQVWIARHALRWGDPQRAAAVLEPLARNQTATIADWAHLAIAWRLLADPRAEWLCEQPGLHGVTDFTVPDEDLDRLANLLRSLHRTRAHPIGQSLRGGTQTRGGLFDRIEPALRNLADRLQAAVNSHMAALPAKDEHHPLLAHRDAPTRISGSWSVRLSTGGFHVHHIHPSGLLSSALYVSLPDWSNENDGKAGWLELGRPPNELALDLAPLAQIEPRVGRLALFPSYMFHGTRPFDAGERLTVAFDVSLAR